MGFLSGPSAPKPPDPLKTAQAQTGQNVSTAIANSFLGNVNQSTPYGSLSYDPTGSYSWTDTSGKEPVTYEVPTFTATQSLNKKGQRLQDAQTGAEINLAELGRDQSKRLGDILGKPMNFNGAPDVSDPRLRGVGTGPNLRTSFGDGGDITDSYGTDFSKDRRRVERALMERMNPSLEQNRTRLESQLTNQGLTRGTEAWDRAMRDFGMQENDARYGAILAGGTEQSRMVGLERDRAVFENMAQGQQFGQNQTRAQFGNDSRQQMFANRMAGTGFNNQVAQQGRSNDVDDRSRWFSEQFAERNQPINEIAALLGTGQVQQPNFVNAQMAQMPTVDYAGLVNANYGQRMNNWQQQNAQHQQLLGGLFGLGAAGIGAF